MKQSGRRTALSRCTGIAAVLLGTVVVPLDSSVNVDFPFITSQFGLSIPLIQWLVISYTLTMASLMLVCGRVADLLGYKRVFLTGCVGSTVAFVLCARAPGYGWLLLFRVLQGIGAGMILSCGPALMTGLYAEAQRARALGLYTAGFAIGGALGSVLAGLLIARFGWSVVFWFRAPVSVVAFALALTLPAAHLRHPERFDAAGAILIVLTTTVLLLALNRLGNPWLAALLLAATGLGACGFIRRERRFPHPIIDVRLFVDARFALANLANALMNLAGFAVPLLVPFLLAHLPGSSVALDGLLLATSSLGMMLGAPLAGKLARQVSSRHLLLAGTVLVAAGLFAIAAQADRVGGLAMAMIVQGVGQGVFQVAYFDVITAAMPIRDRGVAGSLAMLTRTLGLVSGASVLMLMFQWFSGAHAGVGFLAGFRAAIWFAAGIAVLVVAMLFRFPGHARST